MLDFRSMMCQPLMGNRIRLEIVWLRINWETVQTQAKKNNK